MPSPVEMFSPYPGSMIFEWNEGNRYKKWLLANTNGHRNQGETSNGTNQTKCDALWTMKCLARLNGLESFCSVYIDDIIVFSKTEEEHVGHLHRFCIKLHPEKCLGLCRTPGTYKLSQRRVFH